MIRTLIASCAAMALCALSATWQPAAAQELRANVTVNAPQLTIIAPEVIEEFEVVVRDFLNNTRFTEEEYEEYERIGVNFTFSLGQGSERSPTEFAVQLLVQSTRPVYGSDYTSTIINYLDDGAVIQYEQFQPLEFNRNNFTTSLVALLSFHAYIIIGMDKDSFAPLAGETYYRFAEAVLTTLPNNVVTADAGWTNADGRGTRFRLLQELLNPRARPYRELLYDYHRLGLDVMGSDDFGGPVAGRAIITASIDKLLKVHNDVPNSVLIPTFSAAKSQELLEIYAEAPVSERQAVYKTLSAVDPGNINKFSAMR